MGSGNRLPDPGPPDGKWERVAATGQIATSDPSPEPLPRGQWDKRHGHLRSTPEYDRHRLRASPNRKAKARNANS